LGVNEELRVGKAIFREGKEGEGEWEFTHGGTVDSFTLETD
jgi:hypothetical protein